MGQAPSNFRVIDAHGRCVSLSEPTDAGIPVFSSGRNLPKAVNHDTLAAAERTKAVTHRHYPQLATRIEPEASADVEAPKAGMTMETLSRGMSDDTDAGRPDLKTAEGKHPTLPKEQMDKFMDAGSGDTVE